MSDHELRILLLEDADNDVVLIERTLRKAHLNFSSRCEQTQSGLVEALDRFKPDLILADYTMDGFTALDALELMRQRGGKRIPFILVTGSQSEEIAVNCMRRGADDYILKSDLSRLPGALLNALRQQRTEQQRQQAIAALRESEERFRQVAENINEVIWLASPDWGRMIYVSPAYERLWGRACAELYQQPLAWLKSVHAEDRARVELAVLKEVSASSHNTEYRIVRPDGSVRWIHDQAFPVRNVEGEIYRVAGIAADITLRKDAEAALRQKEASLREAQRVGGVGSWELDLTSNALSWSEETYRIFGRSPENFVVTRESFYEAVYPSDREPTRKRLAEALEQRRAYQAEHRIVRPDGSLRWLHNRAELVLGAGGRPARFIGTVQDLTERRQLEEQLHQSQKMEAVGLLAGGVAHDFNNLLTVIRGQTELALADEKLSAEGMESLKQVIAAAERAANLTRQLLTFSRKHPAQLQPLDLNGTITPLVKMLRRLIREDIELEMRLAPDLPFIYADQGLVEQVLMNLAVNARDAMKEGGTLTIVTEAVIVGPELPKTNSMARPGHFVRLSSSDTGTGIPPDILPRIFEPFFTTKGVGSGTGLGLATVYGVIQQHHGWIDVETEVGRGTTFDIYFPLAAAVQNSAVHQCPDSPPARSSGQ